MTFSLLQYFTDPVFKAPMIGSIFMCIGASLMGVLVLIRKKSLLAESLSHASYPGVVLSMIFFHFFFRSLEDWSFLGVLLGAFLSSLLGLWAIDKIVRVGKISSDAALCFVLASFFGVGLLFASGIQISLAKVYKEIQFYLYGQTATMTDIHIVIYAILSSAVIVFLMAFFKQIQATLFSPSFAESIGIKARLMDKAFFVLLALSVVIGIRSVGIVLMSSMLIAPAVAARQLTNKLSTMLLLAAIFGLFSGFLGNYISIEMSLWLNSLYPERTFSLPTGPVIALVGSSFAFLSLLFSPKRGFLFRIARIGCFKYRCFEENLLKSLWKKGKMLFSELKSAHPSQRLFLSFFLMRLIRGGWIVREGLHYLLTKDGHLKAERIIRIHRLWELYLADHLGMGVEKVHRSAEEMEHIITPELEKKLCAFMSHPTKDPHAQPIPKRSPLEYVDG
jgi:manganese/zinc/iron transport system permease protein